MVSIEKIISHWYLFGSGTIFEGFISGCNMKPTGTRICLMCHENLYTKTVSFVIATICRHF